MALGLRSRSPLHSVDRASAAVYQRLGYTTQTLIYRAVCDDLVTVFGFTALSLHFIPEKGDYRESIQGIHI